MSAYDRTTKDGIPANEAPKPDPLAGTTPAPWAGPAPADTAATVRTDPPLPADSAAPRLDASDFGTLLRRRGMDPGPEADGPRYEVADRLGQGSGGTVWAVNDRRLARPLAVKVLNHGGNRGEFVDEARITAELQHPNVLPVHDLDLTADGDPCFMMKRVEGTSLGAALRADPRPAAVATVNGVVSVFIAVAQALAYAHSRGIIHQDVKPDNILLGAYGEVLLVDWGCAVRNEARGRQIHGTPLYMAPEQARREYTNAASDVYAFGASFFHALVGRPPTIPVDDVEVFWDRKRDGLVDAPDAQERAAVPPALLAIALRALAASPTARYPGVEAMLADLRAYQAGLAVSAHHEALWRILLRWYRRHRSECWIAAVAVVLVSCAGGMWWREKAREASSWQLVTDDAFGPPATVAERWHLVSLDWTGKHWDEPLDAQHGAEFGNGTLVLGNPGLVADVVLRDRLCGSLAMEWDVVPLTGLNLNCFLGEDRISGYTFHVAGFGDPSYVALTRGNGIDANGGALLANSNLDPPIEKDRTYHFRIEREGSRLRLFIDGRTIIDLDCPIDPLAAAPTAVGFDTWAGNRLRISHVQLWSRPLPERISPLAVAGALDAAGATNEARREYLDLAKAYGDSDLGVEASFHAALLALRRPAGPAPANATTGAEAPATAAMATSMTGQEQALLDLVAAHPGHPLAPYTLAELHAAAIGNGDGAMAERVRAALLAYPGHPAMQRVLFDIGADRIAEILPQASVDGYPSMPPDSAPATILAEVERTETWARRYGLPVATTRLMESANHTLAMLGREDIVLAHWPAHDRQRGSALIENGQLQEALRDWSHVTGIRVTCLYALGRLNELAACGDEPRLRVMLATNDLAGLRREHPHDDFTAEHLIGCGMAAEVINDSAFPTEYRGLALLTLGRVADAYALAAPGMNGLAIACQLALGRDDEVLAHHGEFFVPYRVAIARWRRGDHQGARDLVALAHPHLPVYMFRDDVFAYYLMPALLALSAGDAADARAQFAASLAPTAHSNGLMYWHVAAYACGQEDAAAFRAQQWQQDLEQRFRLAEGLRADLAGDAAKARTAYAAYLAADTSMDVTDFLRQLVHWRLAERSG
jgi:tRNA A-37 threonylcarbamoyl transferase component Bud32